MMFYSECFLRDSTEHVEGRGGGPGWLIAPSVEEVKACFNNPRTYVTSTVRTFREGSWEILGCSYKVNKQTTEKASIYLNLKCRHSGRTETFNYQICAGTISTTPSNCSALFVSAMSTEFSGSGIGKLFYRGLENWIKKAGYTFVFLSLAGNYQLDHPAKFFKKQGFKNMATMYKNPRSNNTNRWMYKLLGVQDE